ncbi:MAG: hypothetical protein JNJ54_08985 [Myxococcaceae bacterium]|nr:hypothetical protein [Myxococcaceae bacterium]
MTPQPGQSPEAPTSWFSRNWMWVAGGGCLLIGCCGLGALLLVGGAVASEAASSSAARVDCGTPGPAGVECGVKRTEGLGAFRACWDLEIACQNGGKMSGHACGSVAAGADETTVTMPVSSFSNQDACDVPSRGTVQNLAVTNE